MNNMTLAEAWAALARGEFIQAHGQVRALRILKLVDGSLYYWHKKSAQWKMGAAGSFEDGYTYTIVGDPSVVVQKVVKPAESGDYPWRGGGFDGDYSNLYMMWEAARVSIDRPDGASEKFTKKEGEEWTLLELAIFDFAIRHELPIAWSSNEKGS